MHAQDVSPGSLTESLHIALLRRTSLALLEDIAHWNLVTQARELETALHYSICDPKAGFNPDQPRDGHGRWTDSGGSNIGVGNENIDDSRDGIGTGISEGFADEGSDENIGNGGEDTLSGSGTVMDDSSRIYYEDIIVPDTWANSDIAEFENHWEDHGDDFNAQSPEDYADQANQFYQRAQAEKLPTLETTDGWIKTYDPQTNTWGIYNPEGKTESFYKPTSPTYFERQTQDVLARGGRIVYPTPGDPQVTTEIVIPE